MKTSIYILLFCFFSISFAQELVHGEIANEGDTEGIHVFNKTQSKYSITDAKGKFKMPVKLNDTIVFSALQYELKELIVTEAVLQNYQFILLATKINELDIVYLKPKLSGNLSSDVGNIKTKSIVTAKTLGLPNADVIPPTPAERRLQTASSWSSGSGMLSLDALINAISGRTKKLKKVVQWERKSNLEDTVYSDFEQIIRLEFQIPEDEIYRFIFFASNDQLFSRIVKTKSSMVIYEFLQTKAKDYHKLKLKK